LLDNISNPSLLSNSEKGVEKSWIKKLKTKSLSE
jgi:hypothetical protein